MIEAMGQHICNRSDYRIIRRNGAVVPFNPRKIATAMTKSFLAVTGTSNKKSESGRSGNSDTAAGAAIAGAEGAVASSGADGASGGGGGSGGDDGDGDGDSDGPRRRHRHLHRSSAHRPKIKPPTRHRQRVIRTSTDHTAPHRRALIVLLCLPALLLFAAVVFVLLDYPSLAHKTLLALGSVPLLAFRLVKPK
jgi:hypothetical protein